MTRLALAASGVLAVSLLCAPASARDASGVYRAEAEAGACRLTLDPSSAAPEDSLVAIETQSGLVMAPPSCPAGLDAAFFWRAPADGGSLQLIDAAGAPVFEGEAADRGFEGLTPSGQAVTLTPA
ncbi:MAG: hypothetical protein ACOC0V_00465 [Oceanicaulis sp.]